MKNRIHFSSLIHCGIIFSLFFTLGAYADDHEYSPELDMWQEVGVPAQSDKGARAVWSYATNYSKYKWHVSAINGQINARLSTEKPKVFSNKPNFSTQVEGFRVGHAFVEVDDGWLIGFNEGEFGAALFWFDKKGKHHYKISDHQIVDFITLDDGIYAIEGLAHLGVSKGSVIQILRENAGTRTHWQAHTITKLPFAPETVSLNQHGVMFITLSESLVSIGADHKVNTLLADVPWRGLYPNSSVLSSDERTLYIGMRQFVGEFDLKTRKLRLLVPNNQFINKLPVEEENGIRKAYGGGH
jgi:hypothetical protein